VLNARANRSSAQVARIRREVSVANTRRGTSRENNRIFRGVEAQRAMERWCDHSVAETVGDDPEVRRG